MKLNINHEWIKVVEDWLVREERSPAYLARKAHIQSTYIYSLLSGAKRPGRRTLGKLERAMGLPEGTLIGLLTQDPARRPQPRATIKQ